MSKPVYRAAGLLLLALLAQQAKAEQGCPDGLSPIGRAPGPICVPTPGYGTGPAQRAAPRYSAPASMPAITMMPTPQRLRFFGVHVSDPARSQLYSSNYSLDVAKASTLALDYCRQQTGQECVVLGSFVDQCQSIVIDKARKTYRGLDLIPRVAARTAMAECKRGTRSGECRLWRLPLCSGSDYSGGNFIGEDNGRTPEQIADEIATMTRELSAELAAEDG